MDVRAREPPLGSLGSLPANPPRKTMRIDLAWTEITTHRSTSSRVLSPRATRIVGPQDFPKEPPAYPCYTDRGHLGNNAVNERTRETLGTMRHVPLSLARLYSVFCLTTLRAVAIAALLCPYLPSSTRLPLWHLYCGRAGVNSVHSIGWLLRK